MRTLRRAGSLAAALVVLPLSASVSDAADPTPNAAPVAVEDHVTVPRILWNQNVRVLANDTDPDGDALQICRIDAPDDSTLSVHIWSDQGWPGWKEIQPGATKLMVEQDDLLEPGSYDVRYYACDQSHLSPATLTVDVAPISATAVDGQPNVVRFSNPIDRGILVDWWSSQDHHDHGSFNLASGSSLDVQVEHTRIAWAAFELRQLRAPGDDPVPADFGVVQADGTVEPPAPTGHWGPVDAPAYDTDTAPSTQPDHVTVKRYYASKKVPVLANDDDDHPSDLGVCWVDVPAGVGLDVMPHPWWGDTDRARSDDPDRALRVGVNAAEPGTYTVTYYACDRTQMVPGTLTVTVERFPRPVVTRVPGKPGLVEVTNPGYWPIRLDYHRAGSAGAHDHVRVRPHESERFRVGYDALAWSADTWYDVVGHGRLDGIQKPD